MAFPTSPSRGAPLDDDPSGGVRGAGPAAEAAARSDPGIPPVVTAPVIRVRARRPWMAGVAVAIVLVLGIVGVAALVGGRTTPGSASPVIGRVPANASVFAEARLDTPGDQAGNLGALLGRFPATTSGPLSTTALADDLNQVVAMADRIYASGFHPDVRPWVGRAVSIAILPPVDRAKGAGVLALVDVTDVDAARTWILDRIARSGGRATMDAYNGTPVIVEQAQHDLGVTQDSLAAIVDGRTLLVGGGDAVRAALDMKAGTGLGSAPAFEAARAALPGESLAAMWIDVRGLARWFAFGSSSRADPGVTAVSQYLNTLPDWIAVRLRVEHSAVVVERVGPHKSGGTPRPNGADALAARLPPGTLAVIDAHDLGLDLQAYVNVVRSGSTSYVEAVEKELDVVGGLEPLLAQIGTTDVVVLAAGDRLLEGVVAQSRDPAATSRLIESLAAWARRSGMAVATEAHAGVTITRVEAGHGFGLGDGESVEIALRGDLLVAGNRGFVAAVLDTDPAASLATQERYRRVLERVGTPNTQSCYADIAGWVAFADRQAASSGFASTYRESRPWLAQLDTLGCATVAGDIDRTTVVVTMKATP